MNFRDIFNMSNSYIGLVVIGLLIVFLILLEKRRSLKIFSYSFFIAGVVLLVIYFLGSIIIDSFSYRFFIEIISDNFFGSVIVYGVVSIIIGLLTNILYKYIEKNSNM